MPARLTLRRSVCWSSSTSASTTPRDWAYVEVLEDEKATTAAGFLRRAVAFYRRHGISVERVLPGSYN